MKLKVKKVVFKESAKDSVYLSTMRFGTIRPSTKILAALQDSKIKRSLFLKVSSVCRKFRDLSLNNRLDVTPAFLS
jgi:hypothetical protein